MTSTNPRRSVAGIPPTAAGPDSARLKSENNTLRVEYTRLSLRLQENQSVIKEYTALRGEKEALERQLQNAQQSVLEYAQIAAAILTENALLRVENERIQSASNSNTPTPTPTPANTTTTTTSQIQLKQLQAQLAQAAEREKEISKEREAHSKAIQNLQDEKARLSAQITGMTLQFQDCQAKLREAKENRGVSVEETQKMKEKAEAEINALKKEVEEQRVKCDGLEKANRQIKEKVERLVASLKAKQPGTTTTTTTLAATNQTVAAHSPRPTTSGTTSNASTNVSAANELSELIGTSTCQKPK